MWFGFITCLSELDKIKIIFKLQNAYFFDLLVASQVFQIICYLTVTLVLISLWLFVLTALTLLKHSLCLGINGAVGTLLVWIFCFFFFLILAGVTLSMSRWKCSLCGHLQSGVLYAFSLFAVTKMFNPSAFLLSTSFVTKLFGWETQLKVMLFIFQGSAYIINILYMGFLVARRESWQQLVLECCL